MSTPELDRLIVEHILDLDGARRRIEQMERVVWDAQAAILEAWAKKTNWIGEFDPKGDLTVWPSAWVVDGEPCAWFELGFGPTDTGDESSLRFNLTRLVGTGGGKVCLWFARRAGARLWKPIARAKAEAMRDRGFIVDDKLRFYTECTPVTAEMADGFENGDVSFALAPIDQALERARLAEPAFSAMLRQAGEI